MNEIRGAIHIWTAEDGTVLKVPKDIWAKAKFTKSGTLDKRADNTAFLDWIQHQSTPNGDTSRQPEDVIEEQQQMEQPQEAPQDDTAERAQAYALRVWHGQSDALGRGDRIARVKRALEGQGLPFDGVKLPGHDNHKDDGEVWSASDLAPVTMRFARA